MAELSFHTSFILSTFNFYSYTITPCYFLHPQHLRELNRHYTKLKRFVIQKHNQISIYTPHSIIYTKTPNRSYFRIPPPPIRPPPPLHKPIFHSFHLYITSLLLLITHHLCAFLILLPKHPDAKNKHTGRSSEVKNTREDLGIKVRVVVSWTTEVECDWLRDYIVRIGGVLRR